MRKTPIKKVNPARRKKRREEEYGPFADYDGERVCVVGRDCWGPIDPSHLKSRGSGGKWERNIVWMCRGHHTYFHNYGKATFERRYGIDLQAEADGLWSEFHPSTGENDSQEAP